MFCLIGGGLAGSLFFCWAVETRGGDGTGGEVFPGLEPLPGARSGLRAADFFACFRRGAGAISAERYQEAHREFTRAVRLAPDDPRPLVGLAEVYRRLDRDELAEPAYRRALELEPEHLPARMGLSRVWFEMGKNEEALTLLKETNRKYPDRPPVWAAIVRNAMKLGRAEEAIQWLTKYNAVEGRQAWGYERLGRAYAEAGDPRGAEKAFREALEVDPKTILCHLWLGQLLMMQGREEEAKSYFANFRKLMRWKRMERHYEMALLSRPDDLDALSHLALYRHHLGKNKEAWIPLQKALEIAPQHPDLLKLKGMIVPELK